MKKHSNLKIVGLILGVFLISIVFLVLLMAIADDIKDAGRSRKNAIDCFTRAAVKCGYVDNTEEEIIQDVTELNLSQQEVRELILEAQEKDRKSMEEYNKKDSLTEEEKRIMDARKKRIPYYQRVLEAVDKMEKE